MGKPYMGSGGMLQENVKWLINGEEDMQDVKPGWQTTEFWLSIVGQVLPALVTMNVIKQGDVSTLQGALNTIIQSAFALVASAAVIWKYAHTRQEVKSAALTGGK